MSVTQNMHPSIIIIPNNVFKAECYCMESDIETIKFQKCGTLQLINAVFIYN